METNNFFMFAKFSFKFIITFFFGSVANPAISFFASLTFGSIINYVFGTIIIFF